MIKKENTHVVIKREDILKYLEETEQITLDEMLNKIIRGRAKDNKKPINNYYVVNKDEPYAEVVHGIIVGGEAVKEGYSREEEPCRSLKEPGVHPKQ